MNKSIPILILILTCSGCMMVRTRDFSVVSGLNRKTVKGLSYTIRGTNGEIRELRMDGYQSDSVEALKAGLEAAKTLKP